MTDHAEILRGLYDETLVGNKPRVLELTNEGLATAVAISRATGRARRIRMRSSGAGWCCGVVARKIRHPQPGSCRPSSPSPRPAQQ